VLLCCSSSPARCCWRREGQNFCLPQAHCGRQESSATTGVCNTRGCWLHVDSGHLPGGCMCCRHQRCGAPAGHGCRHLRGQTANHDSCRKDGRWWARCVPRSGVPGGGGKHPGSTCRGVIQVGGCCSDGNQSRSARAAQVPETLAACCSCCIDWGGLCWFHGECAHSAAVKCSSSCCQLCSLLQLETC
jgi:hypothetical protein